MNLDSGFRTADSAEPPRALLVAVETGQGPWDATTSLAELAALCESAGLEPVSNVRQRLPHPHPTHYVGSGKLEEIKERVALDAIDVVVADDELSPRVLATLGEELGRRVIDRSAVILDIFARRARTHEGRIQVELAQYEFLLPRLSAMWSGWERTGGGIGTRGPGETQLESDRRRVRQRITALKREIEQVRHHRERLRRRRQDLALPVVALVGYTNVGKTTLLRALTGSASPAVADAPFVTLDPLTRGMRLAGGREVLVSDTVGFISKLPATLVAAFRATLEELHNADLLVHVIDLADPRAAACATVVRSTLRELGLQEKPLILAMNKADAVIGGPLEIEAAAEQLCGQADRTSALGPSPLSLSKETDRGDAVVVSAHTGMGLERLRACIEGKLSAPRVSVRAGHKGVP